MRSVADRFHAGGVVRGGPTRVRIAVDECILARRVAADGAIVCVRRDRPHRERCEHDPVAYTTAVDATFDRLREA
jgi:hypothetical protein